MTLLKWTRCFQTLGKFVTSSFTVWRCKNCGSLHSKEAVDLSKYYAYYPMKRMKADYFSNRMYGNRLRILRAHGLSPGHKILEHGGPEEDAATEQRAVAAPVAG